MRSARSRFAAKPGTQSPTMLRRVFVVPYRALVVLYCVVLATATGIDSAGYFVEPGGALDRLGDKASWLSLPLLVAVVLGAFIPPTFGSLIRAAGAVFLGYVMLTASINIRPHTRDRFFWSRQHEFQAIADATVASGRIRSFWDLPGGTRLLNHEVVAVRPPDSTWALKPLIPLDSVLRRDSIEPAQYEELRRRLQSLHLTQFDVDEKYLFVGDRDAGFVYVLPSHDPYLLRDTTGFPEGYFIDVRPSRGRAKVTKKFTDQWYYVVFQ